MERLFELAKECWGWEESEPNEPVLWSLCGHLDDTQAKEPVRQWNLMMMMMVMMMMMMVMMMMMMMVMMMMASVGLVVWEDA
jgi:hypothetical protein